jgi:hypothetical protein
MRANTVGRSPLWDEAVRKDDLRQSLRNLLSLYGLRHDEYSGYFILGATGLLVFVRVVTLHTASDESDYQALRPTRPSWRGPLIIYCVDGVPADNPLGESSWEVAVAPDGTLIEPFDDFEDF